MSAHIIMAGSLFIGITLALLAAVAMVVNACIQLWREQRAPKRRRAPKAGLDFLAGKIAPRIAISPAATAKSGMLR